MTFFFLPQVVVAVLLENFLIAIETEKSRQQATVRSLRVRFGESMPGLGQGVVVIIHNGTTG